MYLIVRSRGAFWAANAVLGLVSLEVSERGFDFLDHGSAQALKAKAVKIGQAHQHLAGYVAGER